jgi:ferrochelatase
MTPYYSQMSVGAYFQKLQEAQEALDVGAHSRAPLHVTSVESWHDHPLFIRAVTDKVKFALERFPTETRAQVKIVFTAHSLPAALMKQGDPYAAQLRETARLVAARLDLEADDWQLCYQSAGAHKVKWLGPQLKDVVTELAEDGHKRILVVPIGFVADNVEILYDIDIACRDLAAAQGVHLERTESLNTSPTFIQALADIVYQLTEHDNIQL